MGQLDKKKVEEVHRLQKIRAREAAKKADKLKEIKDNTQSALNQIPVPSIPKKV